MNKQLTCQIVRPDKLLYEGSAASIVLVSYTGELAVYPGHASEICALGNGVMRLTRTAQDGGRVHKIVISGGYAEINNDTVLILADHARDADDIEESIVRQTRENAKKNRDDLPEDDHQRAYYQSKIDWCDLLLEQLVQNA